MSSRLIRQEDGTVAMEKEFTAGRCTKSKVLDRQVITRAARQIRMERTLHNVGSIPAQAKHFGLRII